MHEWSGHRKSTLDIDMAEEIKDKKCLSVRAKAIVTHVLLLLPLIILTVSMLR